MIYRKTRLGIKTELGGKNHLCQNKEGDIQGEILVEAYNAFEFRDNSSNPGLSKAEVDAIKKLDKILEKVDFVATPNLDKIHGIEENGLTFTISRGTSKGDLSNEPLNGECEKSILKKAYEQYTQDHKLTKKEIETIEKIDEILPDAAIVINPQTGDATIASPSGFTRFPFQKSTSKRQQ
jgi:hypothetical protein